MSTRKKAIGLDDLLKEHYKEQDRLLEKKQQTKKKPKATKKESSCDDEDRKEARLARIVEKCHNQLTAFGEEQEIPLWGVKVFGEQKAFPPLHIPDLGRCNFLQSFLNKLNSVVELAADKGDIFLEGLLVNGWLSKLAFLCDHVEKPVAIWAFNTNSDSGGPPQNIRAWVRFVTACCLIRSKKAFFSTVEAEEIVEIIICLFLDRQFQGLLVLLNDCMQAIVNYFTDQEWCSSCENIAKFIACRPTGEKRSSDHLLKLTSRTKVVISSKCTFT